MSARWTAQGTPPSSQGRLGPGAPSTANPDVQNIVRLVKSDPDFRNELKNVIAEALQPDLERLRAELLAQMSSNNAAAASSNMPPPLDHEALIQREFPGSSVEEWSHHDEQGSVYGFAETVSSHIIRHNNMAFLCSIKDVRTVYCISILLPREPTPHRAHTTSFEHSKSWHSLLYLTSARKAFSYLTTSS